MKAGRGKIICPEMSISFNENGGISTLVTRTKIVEFDGIAFIFTQLPTKYIFILVGTILYEYVRLPSLRCKYGNSYCAVSIESRAIRKNLLDG